MNRPKPRPERPVVDLEARERLLSAALDAFAKFGYEGTSLRDIADGAGVAFQLIAYHFGAKEELWRCAIEQAYARKLEYGRSLGFDLSGDPREQFRNHIRSLLLDSTQNPQWAKIVVQEYLAQSPRYHEVILPKLREFSELIATPYARQLERLGVLTRYSPEEFLLIIDGVLLGNELMADEVAVNIGKARDSRESIEWQVELLHSLFERGLGPHRAPAAVEDGPDAVTARTQAAAGAHRGEWGEVYNSVNAADLRRLKQLEAENQQLKQLVGELTLEKRLLLARPAGQPSGPSEDAGD